MIHFSDSYPVNDIVCIHLYVVIGCYINFRCLLLLNHYIELFFCYNTFSIFFYVQIQLKFVCLFILKPMSCFISVSSCLTIQACSITCVPFFSYLHFCIWLLQIFLVIILGQFVGINLLFFSLSCNHNSQCSSSVNFHHNFLAVMLYALTLIIIAFATTKFNLNSPYRKQYAPIQNFL